MQYSSGNGNSLTLASREFGRLTTAIQGVSQILRKLINAIRNICRLQPGVPSHNAQIVFDREEWQ